MSEGTADQVKYIRDLYARFTVLIHEIAKFAVVGGIGFLVQISVTDGVHLGLGLGPLTAVVIGYVISAVVTFLGNRHWAFKHRQGKGLRHETLMFVFLNLIALGIQEAVVGFVHYGLNRTDGLSFTAANVVGIGIGTLFRLWSYRKWVFLAVEEAPSLAEQVKPLADQVKPVVTGQAPAEEPEEMHPEPSVGWH